MINSGDEAAAAESEDLVDVAAAAGPIGAATVAGLATAIVVGIWVAFYFLVFVPRGAPPP